MSVGPVSRQKEHPQEHYKGDCISLGGHWSKADEHWSKGIECARDNRWDEAIKNFQEHIKIRKYNRNAYYNLGLCFHKLEFPKQAIKNYQTKINMMKNTCDAECLNNLACLLGAQEQAEEQWGQALKLLQQANTHLADPSINCNIGLILISMRSYQQAQKYLQEAWEKDQTKVIEILDYIPSSIRGAFEKKKNDQRIRREEKLQDKEAKEQIFFIFQNIRTQMDIYPHELCIEYEYLPNQKKINALKQQLAYNFNVAYYLNNEFKLEFKIEKLVVLTDYNQSSKRYSDNQKDDKQKKKLDFLWSDYEQFEEVRNNKENSSHAEEDMHQLKKYFKKYHQTCEQLKHFLSILNEKRRAIINNQIPIKDLTPMNKLIYEGNFKIKIYKIEKIQKEKVKFNYYFGQLSNCTQLNEEYKIDQYFFYIPLKHEEQDPLYIKERSDNTEIQSLQREQNDEKVFHIQTKIRYEQHPINPDIQFVYNVNHKNMKDIQVIKVFLTIEDEQDFLYEVINKKIDENKFNQTLQKVKEENQNSNTSLGKNEIQRMMVKRGRQFLTKFIQRKEENTIFFTNQVRDMYNDLDGCYLRKGTVIPYREGKFDRQVSFYNKHLSLAFRGGGAKGLAYAGACRALEEMRQKYHQRFDNPMLIKSIIGTSAGGIVGLAVSTGIDFREIQTVLENMKQIPEKNERFSPSQQQTQKQRYEVYQQKMKELRQTFIHIATQYGLIDRSLGEKIATILSEVIDKMNKQFQSVSSKTWNQMLDHVIETNFFFDKIRDRQTEQQQKKQKLLCQTINLQGLLYHGALFSGTCNSDTAALCLLKYFEKDMKIAKKSKTVDNLKWKYISIFDEASQLKNQSACKRQIQYFGKKLFQASEKLYNLKQQFKEIALKDLFNIKIVGQDGKFTGSFVGPVFIAIINKILYRYFGQNNNLKKFVEEYVGKQHQGESQNDTPVQKLYSKYQKELKIKSDFIFDLATLNKENTQIRDLWTLLGQMSKWNKEDNEERNLLDQNNKNNLEDSEMQKIFKYIISKVVDKQQEYIHDNFFYFLNPSYFRFENQENRREAYQKNVYKYIDQMFTIRPEREINMEQEERGYTLIPLGQIEEIITTTLLQFMGKYKLKYYGEQQESDFTETFSNYKKSKEKLLQYSHEITLREYYNLTRIEFTCTTVDLDNKILRFLNHKTTPDLPVTTAVRMTTSFPGAFKALKWNKKWGNYYIYFSRQRLSIDLTGNQMTDGGILANFPLKYTDNDDLNNKYFTFSQKSTTEVIGIGLDYVSQQNYHSSWQDKTYSTLFNPSEGLTIFMSIIKQKFVGFLKSKWNILIRGLGQVVSRFFNKINPFSSSDARNISWKLIEHGLVHKIPLVNFGLKILDSWTKADRNFNLEVFYQRIMTEQIQDDCWINYQKCKKQDRNDCKFRLQPKLRSLIFRYQDYIPIAKQYKRPQRLSFIQSDENHEKKYNQLTNFIKLRLQEVKIRDQIIKKKLTEGQSQQQNFKKQGLKKLSIALHVPQFLQKFKRFMMNSLLLKKVLKKDKVFSEDFNNFLSFLLDKSRNYYKKVILCVYFYSKIFEYPNQPTEQDRQQIRLQLQQVQQFHYYTFKKEAIEKVQYFICEFVQSEFPDKKELNINSSQIQYKLMSFIVRQEDNNDLSQKIGWIKRICETQMPLAQIDAIKARYSTLVENKLQFEIFELYKFLFEKETGKDKDIDQVCREKLKKFTSSLLDQLNSDLHFYDYLKDWKKEDEDESKKGFIGRSAPLITRARNIKKLLSRVLYLIKQKGEGQEQYLNFDQIQQIKAALFEFFCGENKEYYQPICDDKSYCIISTSKKDLEETLKRQQCSINTQIKQFSMEKHLKLELKYLVIQERLAQNKISEAGSNLQSLHKKYKQSFDMVIASLYEAKIYLKYLVSYNPDETTVIDLIKAVDKYIQSLTDHVKFNYTQLLDTYINQIDKTKIQRIYIIQYRIFQGIFQEVYLAVKKQYQQLLLQLKDTNSADNAEFIKVASADLQFKFQHFHQQKNLNIFIYKFVIATLERLHFCKITLPYFLKEMQIFQKTHVIPYLQKQEDGTYTQRQYSAKVVEKLDFVFSHQNNMKYQGQYQQRIFKEVKREVQNRLKKCKNFEMLEIKEEFQTIAQQIKKIPAFQQNYQKYHEFYGILEELFNLNHKVKKTSFDKHNYDTHLILEGTKNCEQYLSTYYELAIKHIKPKDQSSKKQFKIKAITCTNFHCLFGFLLACNLSSNEVRVELMGLKRLSDHFEQNIAQQFESYTWYGRATQNNYAKLLEHLRGQLQFGLFEKIKKRANKLTYSHRQILQESLKKQVACTENFKEIIDQIVHENYYKIESILQNFEERYHDRVRRVIEEIKQDKQTQYNHKYKQYSMSEHFKDTMTGQYALIEKYQKNVQNVIDSISEAASKFDKDPNQADKLKTIMEDYAINNRVSLEDLKKINADIFEQHKANIIKVEKQFGSLIYAIVCEFIQGYSHIHIKNDNFKDIVKGIFIKKLLSAYQIKQYVIDKLKKIRLDPQTTLEEFYNSMPRQILLNFCVINADRQRIQFLNKNNTPHMPVWAAIVAASSVPLFYQFVEIKQEWQRTTGHQFYQKIVKDYFKDTPRSKATTRYCSSTFLAGLPLELITNKTLSRSIGDINNYKEVVFAFNENNSYIENIELAITSTNSKVWLLLKQLKLFKKLTGFFTSLFRGSDKSQYDKFKEVYIKNKPLNKETGIKEPSLKQKYSTIFIKNTLDSGNILKAFKTITEANQKSIYQWYCEKLYMLPMKFNTLDNSAIFNFLISQKYGINISSPKAQETIERSYEITKSFAQHIFSSNQTQEKINEKLSLMQKMTKKEKLEYRLKNENQVKQMRKQGKCESQISKVQIPKRAIRIKMRVSIIDKKQKGMNQPRKYLKLDFLNHSKWNQNQISTYLVQMRVFDRHYPYYCWQQTKQSQFLLNIGNSYIVEARFCFPKHDYDCQKYSKIYFVEKCLNFKNVAKYFTQSNQINKYNYIDYEFQFDQEYRLQTHSMVAKFQDYKLKGLHRSQKDENLKFIKKYWPIYLKKITQCANKINQRFKKVCQRDNKSISWFIEIDNLKRDKVELEYEKVLEQLQNQISKASKARMDTTEIEKHESQVNLNFKKLALYSYQFSKEVDKITQMFNDFQPGGIWDYPECKQQQQTQKNRSTIFKRSKYLYFISRFIKQEQQFRKILQEQKRESIILEKHLKQYCQQEKKKARSTTFMNGIRIEEMATADVLYSYQDIVSSIFDLGQPNNQEVNQQQLTDCFTLAKKAYDMVFIAHLQEELNKCTEIQGVTRQYLSQLAQKHNYIKNQDKMNMIGVLNNLVLTMQQTKTAQPVYHMSPLHIHEHLIMSKTKKDIQMLKQYPPSIAISATDQERNYLSNYHRQGTGKFYFEQIRENYFEEEQFEMLKERK